MSEQAKVAGELFSLTLPVVMTHPNLFVARAFGSKGKESGEPKFSANFIFAADSPELAAMKTAAGKVARARWPSRPFKDDQGNPTIKFPFSAGDKINARRTGKGKKADEHIAGKVVVAGRSKYEPRLAILEPGRGIVELEGPAREANKSKFYPGVEVLAQFNFVAYDGVGANPDGVTAYLNMVLSTNKGKKIATGASAAEVFKGYAGHATTEDPTGGDQLDDEIPF